MDILQYIKEPWPWYISGMAIAAVMLLLIFAGRSFGFSSNLKTICAMCGAGRHVKFFNYNWRKDTWNLLFLAGSVAGGFIGHQYLSSPEPLKLSAATVSDIGKLGFEPPKGIQPEELFAVESLGNIKVIALLIIGGLFIGFGTRWAGGCTSGHAISGLSNLQLPSLISVIGFFIGGLLMTHLLFPLIFHS